MPELVQHTSGLLARQSGGYQYAGFGARDMYNQIATEKRQLEEDSKEALRYLGDLASIDPCFVFQGGA